MAYVKRKRIKGRDYYYLAQSYRENGKVKTRTLRYLGTEKPQGYQRKSKLQAPQAALDKCKGTDLPPEIQSDNGSAYISKEFKVVLSQMGVGHHRIHPYCPEENGIAERMIRTVKGEYSQLEFKSLVDARERIGEIARWYNEERLHSTLHFLRPVDYYKGNPEELLEIRKEKLIQARLRRKEMNIGLKKQIQEELPTIASTAAASFAKELASVPANVDNSKNVGISKEANRTKSKEPICAIFS